MRFDLVDLRLFEAVVRAGSISGGALQSHLALASASARIAGMEATLGVALLERRPRGVVATEAGEALLHHARTITGQVERMRGDLRLFSTRLRGEIRIMSNTAALITLVPRVLRAFLLTHAGLNIDVEERTSAEIALAVAAGEAAFGIVASGPYTEALETRPLTVDRLSAVVARGHPLAGRPNLDFAAMIDEPFVGLSAGALHDHLAQQAARLGRRIQYRVRLRNFEAVARLIAAGVGVGILPLAAVRESAADGLAVLPLSDAWADRRLTLCARRFADLSVHARLLADEFLRQSAQAPPA